MTAQFNCCLPTVLTPTREFTRLGRTRGERTRVVVGMTSAPYPKKKVAA
jgi:hypothetical protein